MTLSTITRRRLAWTLFGVTTACYVAGVVFEFLNPAGRSTWGTGSLGVMVAYASATYCFAVVGVLIVHREPRNVVGWLMLVIGLIWGYIVVTDGYVLYGYQTRPGAVPRPDVVAALSSWAWLPAIGLMGTFLILLFPDGRPPSTRWRGVLWVSGATIVVASVAEVFLSGPVDSSVTVPSNPLGISALDGVLTGVDLAIVLLPICILASAAGLVVRFRASRGVERLQLKWLATAGAFVALLYFATMLGTLFELNQDRSPGWLLSLQDAGLVSFALIPAAIGVAILKHRLYGIDVVINKSVVFGALATFITAVYVLIVVGVGTLLGRGDRPNLTLSVAATAVVAVAFQPVRDKVQRFANRLVYGARATPYEVLADFADRVGGTYGASELLPMMARTVGEGVSAQRVEIWLAVGGALSLEAAWPGDGSLPADRTAPTSEELTGDRVVPVRHQGELLGAITVRKAPGEQLTPAEGRLLDDVAAQAGLVLRNVRLIEELRGSRQRLVRTQDQERRRLERNLHDGAQQSLVAVALMIRMVRARITDGTSPVADTLDRAADQLTAAIEELRELARGIHPAILTERGYAAAVATLAERCRVPVVVDNRLDERPPPEVEAAMYHVVAEGLTNVVKHARATEARVRTLREGDVIALEVSDDGVGGADPERGSGLRGLADRVAAVDGTFFLTERPGGGTLISCTFPVPSPVPAEPPPAPMRTAQPLGAGQ